MERVEAIVELIDRHALNEKEIPTCILAHPKFMETIPDLKGAECSITGNAVPIIWIYRIPENSIMAV